MAQEAGEPVIKESGVLQQVCTFISDFEDSDTDEMQKICDPTSKLKKSDRMAKLSKYLGSIQKEYTDCEE